MDWNGIQYLVVIIFMIKVSFSECGSILHYDNLLVISTDGGADDAVALIQILLEPMVKVLAITCMFGNVPLKQACENVKRTLEVVGKAGQVPLYIGSDRPLVGNITQDHYFGSDGLSNNAGKFHVPEIRVGDGHASNAIVDYVIRYSSKVSLLALGPLTDVALARMIDPNLPKKLKRLVFMGGTSEGRGTIKPNVEFNMYQDPVAARLVLSEFHCPVSMVPFELCLDYMAPWSWYDEWVLSNNRVGYFIDQIYKLPNIRQKQLQQNFSSCDLIASTVFLYPKTVTASKKIFAQVETCGLETTGYVVIDNRLITASVPNVEIYFALDWELVLHHWKRITSSPSTPKK